ncbi:MAG: AAA family ATPase [Bacteroidales bacterium]
MKSKSELERLRIKNFRCIGKTPVDLELDDIVVLVGANNAGKSSILIAYEIIMNSGSNEGKLTIDDFPNKRVDPSNLPEVELHTILYDNFPGDEWCEKIEANKKRVKEKWIWNSPNVEPIRRGYNVILNRWANDDDKEKVPWGAHNIAQAYRPQPHRISAFDTPEQQTEELRKLLDTVIKDRLEKYRKIEESEDAKPSEYSQLLSNIRELQEKVVKDSKEEIDKLEKKLTNEIDKIFPNYVIQFDAKSEEGVDKSVTFFNENSQLLMGPKNGFLSNIELQGSGARRTLLWSTLKMLTESGIKARPLGSKSQKMVKIDTDKMNVLLLDEPEICLHPNAIRDVNEVLYRLPESKNWQVIITTHSPQFIDISKDNTTIVRVDRDESGEIFGSTIYRPKKAKLSDDDKEFLKLLNLFDPYVAEFFFGGKVIIVEGDTEYTAFKHIIRENPERFKNIHIIRARGKATIVSLCKVLNQFGSNYSILHDSDTPKCKRKDKDGVLKEMTNPAWTKNNDILKEAKLSACNVRVIASIPNFEGAYYNEELKNEKPYAALKKLKENPDVFKKIEQLLIGLLEFDKSLPENAKEWNKENELEGFFN